MLNNAVSMGNIAAGRIIAGMLTMSMDHPFLLCCIISGLAGSACAVLLDVVAPRLCLRSVAVETGLTRPPPSRQP